MIEHIQEQWQELIADLRQLEEHLDGVLGEVDGIPVGLAHLALLVLADRERGEGLRGSPTGTKSHDRGTMAEDEKSVEIKHKDYFYYSRYRKKDKDQGHYSIACRKFENMKAPEEIIYDGDHEAKGNKYFSYTTALSLNQNKLAESTALCNIVGNLPEKDFV